MFAANRWDEVATVVNGLEVGRKECAAINGERCGGVHVDEANTSGEAGLDRWGRLEVVNVERGVGAIIVEGMRLDGICEASVRAGCVWDGGEGGNRRRDREARASAGDEGRVVLRDIGREDSGVDGSGGLSISKR